LQLRKLVEAGVSQEELRQILNQLRNLGQTSPPPPSVSAPYPVPSLPLAASHPPYPHLTFPHPAIDQPKTEATDKPSLPSVSANSDAITSLLETLVKAGVVSAAGATGNTTSGAKEPVKPPVDIERESSRAYRKSILAQKVKLTSADITKYVHGYLDLTIIDMNRFTGHVRKLFNSCISKCQRNVNNAEFDSRIICLERR